MLRNDTYWFLRLGVADRAGRQHRPHPRREIPPAAARAGAGGRQASTTSSGPPSLREVSALTAYHWVYRESIQAWLVADLLILNRQMPRSLASCHARDRRAARPCWPTSTAGAAPSQRLASNTLARLEEARIDDLFQSGMHEFITGFIRDNAALGDLIAEQYLV